MHKIKLSNCVSLISYPRISTNELNSKTYITTDNMLPNKAGIVESKNMPRNISVIKFIKDDVLLSNIRPYFKKIWLAEFEGGCSTDVLIFRVNKNYNPKYIKYCLSQDSFFRYDMLGAKGSKMPRGDKNHILNFEILDIDLKSQNSIAKTLSLLDDKIKLNNKTNCELEKMAKEIYDYWFVQFEFPDKNNRPYKSNNGKMVYNEILKRNIPYSWEVKPLKKICDIYQPKTISKKECIPNGKYLVYGSNGIIGRYDKKNHDEYEIVVSCRGDCGNILRTMPNAWITGNAMVIHPYNLSKEYLYHSLQYAGIKQITTGSVQGQITRENISPINILIPQEHILKKYSLIAANITDLILNNNLENMQLERLRDWLLPMLMNGQVKVLD